MLKVDAIGKTCPIPVIMTKNTLKSLEEGKVEVFVDNDTSAQNVEKFCSELKYKYSTTKENGITRIEIIKSKEDIVSKVEENIEVIEPDNTVIVIDSEEMGKGEEALGKTLMKGFIYTLTELEILPKTIILYNKGVLLAVEGCETEKDLKDLEESGVEILSCGACTNYYHVTEKIKVGTITNMYNIINKQMKAKRIIKP